MNTFRRVVAVMATALIIASLFLTPLFGNKLIVIVSGSMEPTIHTYALALVHFCDIDDLDIGDIIVYYHPGFDELITHRVIEKGLDWVHTQGDANNIADDINVIDDNLYGKVTYVANWAVPVMSRFVSDRQFDRAAMFSVLMVFAMGAMSLVIGLSLIIVYLTAFVFAVLKRPYKSEELKGMAETLVAITDACCEADKLTLWSRVKLRVAYRVWKRWFKDMQSEVNTLHRKKVDEQ